MAVCSMLDLEWASNAVLHGCAASSMFARQCRFQDYLTESGRDVEVGPVFGQALPPLLMAIDWARRIDREFY